MLCVSAAPSPSSPKVCVRRVVSTMPQLHTYETLDLHVLRQELEDGENDNYLYGVCAMQGWRTEMVRCLRECWRALGVAATTTTPQRNEGVRVEYLRPCVCSAPDYDDLAGASVTFERLASTGNASAQEDAHAVALGLADRGDAALFAIYDGHGGKEVAKFAAVHMVRATPDLLDVQLSKYAAAPRNAQEPHTYLMAWTRCLGGVAHRSVLTPHSAIRRKLAQSQTG